MGIEQSHLPQAAELRLHVCIRGAVQGVGFRPFVFRLAEEMNLVGWVLNSGEGVFIEVEGMKDVLDQFLLRVQEEKPQRSFIQSLEFSFLDVLGFTSFEIRESDSRGPKTALVLPDIATCPECVAEIFDRRSRRYLYPFTNCTNCGPRFSIIEALPYDRQNTSMRQFAMCPDCRREYEDPVDRRFHAQPIACPICGPRLELWNESGPTGLRENVALLAAEKAIRDGRIVAVKGVGGFHLIVDARSDEAVNRLRERKHREEKPFALMLPSLEMILDECVVSDLEKRLLLSPEAPIVLLQRKDNRELFGKLVSTLGLSGSIAPSNPNLGIMLPSNPLHHILMRDLGHAVVATSGNLSDEPLCTDEREAFHRLAGIADLFLMHNRPIFRHVDDSLSRVLLGRELVLRRARGYAPLPVQMAADSETSVLALGAHLKNTVALSLGTNAFISQHIGDLETRESLDAFHRVRIDLPKLFDAQPTVAASDLHPDYLSTQEARTLGADLVQVQHHHAHVLSCMAENQLEGEVLGVSWDGTGYGTDGTIWGGEFLICRGAGFRRYAAFRSFKLPGGEKAIREPRRSACGLLFELFGEGLFAQKDLLPLASFTVAELSVVQQMLMRDVNAPRTSSAGRLFDAVSSLIGLRQKNSFEGQAAMELEFALSGRSSEETYKCELTEAADTPGQPGIPSGRNPQSDHMIVDWSMMVSGLLSDLRNQVPSSIISLKFHNALAESIVQVAQRAGISRVVLSGGCFQNKYLAERADEQLRLSGFRPYWHQRVPPNDGGISLGQAYAVHLMRSKQCATSNSKIEERTE